MIDFKKLSESLVGKVRGNPVAISLFKEEIPASYQQQKVVPCSIVRHAMDKGEIVSFDQHHHDCTTGVYTAGVDPGTEEIRNGQYLARNIPSYTDLGAERIKTGDYVLPQNTVVGIGAAPLANVPQGIHVDWVVVVCTPHWANFIGGARTVLDGTPPRGACGSSFCSDLFATPWHDDNVVITPGDLGGRMNNRLKPEEMFVVVPNQYLESLFSIMTSTPDARAVLEATKPEDSEYWEKRKRSKQAKKAKASKPSKDSLDAKLSMSWEQEAKDLIAMTPPGIIEMAINNVEDFARDMGVERITKTVVLDQMKSIGMDPSMLN
tara:strand:- start:296 stop:1258 length:963 start_codon:yes stop_codon:yes gene_type:complete